MKNGETLQVPNFSLLFSTPFRLFFCVGFRQKWGHRILYMVSFKRKKKLCHDQICVFIFASFHAMTYFNWSRVTCGTSQVLLAGVSGGFDPGTPVFAPPTD